MKKLLCLLLSLVMVLALCACGATPENDDITGFWEGKNSDKTKYVWFSENGSYMALTVDPETGSILDDGVYGEWHIDGNEVMVVEDELGSTMVHTYSSSGKLKNGAWTYEKSSSAEDFLTDLFS